MRSVALFFGNNEERSVMCFECAMCELTSWKNHVYIFRILILLKKKTTYQRVIKLKKKKNRRVIKLKKTFQHQDKNISTQQLKII